MRYLRFEGRLASELMRGEVRTRGGSKTVLSVHFHTALLALFVLAALGGCKPPPDKTTPQRYTFYPGGEGTLWRCDKTTGEAWWCRVGKSAQWHAVRRHDRDEFGGVLVEPQESFTWEEAVKESPQKPDIFDRITLEDEPSK